MEKGTNHIFVIIEKDNYAVPKEPRKTFLMFF